MILMFACFHVGENLKLENFQMLEFLALSLKTARNYLIFLFKSSILVLTNFVMSSFDPFRDSMICAYVIWVLLSSSCFEVGMRAAIVFTALFSYSTPLGL